MLRSSEKIVQALGNACEALEGGEDIPGACDLLSDASSALETLRSFPQFGQKAEQLENLRIELSDIAASLSGSLRSMEFDKGEAEAVEKRLRQIARLKSRYGGSVEEILEHCRKAKEELEGISSQKETLQKIVNEARQQKEKVVALANDLTEARLDAACRSCP